MKKSDIAMIVLVASVSIMISFAIANQIPFLKPPKEGQKVYVMEKISETVDEPSEKVFNAEAINPTVKTVIGGGQAASE